MEQKANWIPKHLNPKLSLTNIGPFKIIKVLANNHVQLDIDGNELTEVHMDDITLYKSNTNTNTNKFKHKPTEKIIIQEIPTVLEDNEIPAFEDCLPISENNKYNVQTIVGKRIMVWWPSLRLYYSGIVIGYTNDLLNNLVFYDVRNEGVAPEIDFVKAKLYGTTPKSRIEVWKIIPDRI